jgi:hypothetical protein
MTTLNLFFYLRFGAYLSYDYFWWSNIMELA